MHIPNPCVSGALHPETASGPHRRLTSVLFAALLAILVYLPVVRNQFVYDDYLIIVKNPYISSIDFLKAIPTHDYFHISGEASYRPAASLYYYIIASISGIKPAAFHLSSIILHACVTVLVLLLCRRIGMGSGSIWTATAFAVHPLLSEAVCAISYAEDILVTFFILTALIAAINPVLSFWKRLSITAAASTLACLSKESGVVILPLIGLSLLILKDTYLTRKQAAIILSAVTCIISAFILVRFLLLPGIPQDVHHIGESLPQVILNSSLILIRYVGRMIFPATLLADRIPDLPQSLSDWRLWTAMAGHLALLLIACISWHRTRLASFGILWFYICIAPVSNLLAMSCPEADRYLYLAGIGLLIAGITGAQKTAKRWPSARTGITAGLICLIALWTARTTLRIPQWHDNLSLWSHEAAANPLNDRALTELAVHANSEGLHKDAALLAQQALCIKPSNQLARLQQAKANHASGDHLTALPLYREVLASGKLHPHLQSDAWLNCGMLLEDHLSNSVEAEAAYRESLKCSPAPTASLRLGTLLAAQGNLPEAVHIWKQALLLYPGNPALQANITLAEKQVTSPLNPSAQNSEQRKTISTQ